jgi:hypothetical protein
MLDNKTCLPNGVGNPSTHQQEQRGDTVIDVTSEVFIHTYKIAEEGSGRAFILRIPVEIKSPDLALEQFLQISQRYILSKLAEEEFLVFGASFSHLTSERASISEYFKQEQLSEYSSIDDAYCDLLEEWELRETVYH